MKQSDIREQWAVKIIILTAVLFILLSILFSWFQNPVIKNNDHIISGILVFEKHGCVQCHSIYGKGNTRLPLDGIGSRLSEKEIRHWIVADPAIRNKLSPGIIKFKSSYADMPEQEMKQLLNLLKNSE
jgi:hypothetical protein